MIHATDHFAARVHERVAPDADPAEIATGIRWALEHNRRDLVAYLGRQDRRGRRRALFRHVSGREFVAVFRTDGEAWTFITVHRPERDAHDQA